MTAQEISGVIFDLGHTLMHLNSSWPEVARRGAIDLAACVEAQPLGLDGQAFARALLARREEGYARAKETMREVTAERTMLWVYAHFGVSQPAPDLVRSSIDAFFAYEDSRWQADSAAVTVLRELAGRRLQLGMFSNATDDRFIQSLVDRLGFRPWLAPALSSAGTGIRKPDPTAFAPILAAWELSPQEVVMVGDTLEADILGAENAGMRRGWIGSREDARQEGRDRVGARVQQTFRPDVTISRLEELPGCLHELERRSGESP